MAKLVSTLFSSISWSSCLFFRVVACLLVLFFWFAVPTFMVLWFLSYHGVVYGVRIMMFLGLSLERSPVVLRYLARF